MICEPIVFSTNRSGDFQLPDVLPLKTAVDVQNLVGLWLRTEKGSLIIELGERRVIYDRIGYTPEGHWVCRLRVDQAAQSEE